MKQELWENVGQKLMEGKGKLKLGTSSNRK